MNLTQLLLKPIVTEKTLAGQKFNRYVFEVDPKATKNQIKSAVEQNFKVHVTAVRTLILKATSKRTGRKRLPGMGQTKKKAIISLKSGETIALFEAKV